MKPKTLLLLLLLLMLCSCSREKKRADKITKPTQKKELHSYWNKQRKGTNYFNKTPTEEWFDAANTANIKLIRLTYEKWKGEQRDFLLGNADSYQGIIESDFLKLKYFLDYADKLGMKIVITPITLPGARWIQMNNNKRDHRLWKNGDYKNQAVRFWKDLAIKLKDHPAIVGYNIVNEPHPEVAYHKYSFWDGNLREWYKEIKGGEGDLNRFYHKVTKAIRSVDTATTIVVESGLYATPWAFDYLAPIEDKNVIYSFHMYEPYAFTTKKLNKGTYSYPSKMYIEELEADFSLDKNGLIDFLQPINDWTEKHQIPSDQIWVGEFGCNRHIIGVELYLQDLVSIFNRENWHWSFYAYREDVWEAMDYELGTEKVFYKYWEYQDSNTLHLHYDDIYGRAGKKLWTIFEKEFVTE